ncbi:MAG: bifunctional phosphopantothenoylcysteine decarboxylase/phosphopantothenate--cysteine ligase CoaBC [Clostridia bacterium]|nr:bifunctional phosphopantothenoylcysteine decarboxylase/phosphopantothenate--cysteine ligase CoaBC [Clostridia bacterium]
MRLTGKTVVLGVTGGIAAYKSVEVVSRLRKKGAAVRVIMTENAAKLVAPLTFETLSNGPVSVDTFAREGAFDVQHITLAKAADVFVVAPATANILAKMAWGLADDMLSTTLLATKAPVLVAPAMNTGMWTAEATQRNCEILRERGVRFVGPEGGFLACGDEGAGRMSEPAAIVEAIEAILCPKRDLEGLRVMVTAGATRERLDPVRFLSNDSSGKMGFAIAEAAKERGAETLLVCGVTTAEAPADVPLVRVESTQELYEAVTGRAGDMDVIIQAAAPADYRFAQRFPEKLKKQSGAPLTLELVENPDIAAAVGKNKRSSQTLVGFAAETEHLRENAKAKLKKKNLDLIVANDVTQPGAGFNVDTNIAALITEEGIEERPLQSKRALAEDILDKVVELRKRAKAE